MKRVVSLCFILIITMGFCVGCGQSSASNADDPAAITVVQTYLESEKEGRLVTYYELSDGTWQTENYHYDYKLELTGRLHNAATDTTFVCLSNSESVSFSKIADSIFSSNTADFLDREEVAIVEILY